MNTILVILLAVLAAALLFVVAPMFTRAFLRARGPRVVTCPENKQLVAVEANAASAAAGSLIGHERLRLADCTRWPEKQGCGQECLAEVEAAPDGCLVRTKVSHWYEGKPCVYCKRIFGEIPWTAHRPALLDAQGNLVEWRSLQVEKLPEILATHWPVCWDCLVLEAVRRKHPERVTYREGKTPQGG